MTEKNIKKFIRLYREKAEKHFADFGYYYPPADWDGFIEQQNNIYQKHLKECKDNVLRTKLYLSLLDDLNHFGFYVVFQELDYQNVHRVVYQTSRQKLLDHCTTAGVPHNSILSDVLNNFAANEFQIINSFFPKEIPDGEGKFYTEIVANIIKTLYYGTNEKKPHLLDMANQFLTRKKRTSWEIFTVRYFVSLLNKDASEAGLCLQELCKAYQQQGYPKPKMEKCFATEIHGMYRFIRAYNKEFFDAVAMPDHDCFFREFEEWERANNFPKGDLFYSFPAPLTYMNQLLKAGVPAISSSKEKNVYKPRTVYIDHEKFSTDLTHNARNS